MNEPIPDYIPEPGEQVIYTVTVDRTGLHRHDGTPDAYAVVVFPNGQWPGGCMVYGYGREYRKRWMPNPSTRWLVMHLLKLAGEQA